MKPRRYKLRTVSSEHVLFYGYRWLAWTMAGLALPFMPGANHGIQAGLLVLAGVWTIALTALAQPYVRVVRRRPLIMALDMLAGLALVWVSGGGVLPFLPFALGALILPALLLRWQSALIAGLVFAALDLVALIAVGMPTAEGGWETVLIRAGAALVIVAIWSLVARLAGSAEDRDSTASPGDPPAPTSVERLTRDLDAHPFPRFSELNGKNERNREQVPSDMPVAARLAAIHAADRGPRELRRAISSPTPAADVELSVTLDHLAESFSRSSGVTTRLALIGTEQHLTPAQSSTLLKLAQEALINVQQHARAHTALLTLRYEPNAITLVIQDDGVGLLDGTYERPGVHSLRAMHYRLSEFDGRLDVFEGENGGVVVRGTLPRDQ